MWCRHPPPHSAGAKGLSHHIHIPSWDSDLLRATLPPSPTLSTQADARSGEGRGPHIRPPSQRLPWQQQGEPGAPCHPCSVPGVRGSASAARQPQLHPRGPSGRLWPLFPLRILHLPPAMLPEPQLPRPPSPSSPLGSLLSRDAPPHPPPARPSLGGGSRSTHTLSQTHNMAGSQSGPGGPTDPGSALSWGRGGGSSPGPRHMPTLPRYAQGPPAGWRPGRPQPSTASTLNDYQCRWTRSFLFCPHRQEYPHLCTSA